jgi:hypothetical protein
MSDYDHHEYAVSIPEIDQATLEAGLIARILAVPSDYLHTSPDHTRLFSGLHSSESLFGLCAVYCQRES